MTQTDLPRRIALIGGMGAGKTHIASLLSLMGWAKWSFATPLKMAASELQDPPSRELLQALSVVCREVEPAPLMNLMTDRLVRAPIEKSIVVDDCRFPDELELLREHGFKAVRISAPDSVRWARLRRDGRADNQAQLNHPSEVALAGTDLPVIKNHSVEGHNVADSDLIRQMVEVIA